MMNVSQGQLEQFIEQAIAARPIRTAVVHPVAQNGLCGAIEAAEKGIIDPILIGPETRIRACAEEEGLDISPYVLIDVGHSHAAADKAVALIKEQQAEILMKADLSTAELLEAVIDKQHGIRTERRLSHVFVLDVPNYHKPLFITDAAINIDPKLPQKKDIIQNCIDFCQALGIAKPKVAILAAVEKVKSYMPATIDAAALCKMADRGQIKGAILDGPLAFDNAISKQAAEDKHIHSPVSGDADILLAPDLESANMLAKQLMYLANAKSAGIALGAKVPIVLNSRADGTLARLASCALASQLVLHKA
ncbi:bifunctional enoyl-CoA hydratase/phosphate acetyltransferase [Pseudoteredinibacter isoporae]|uniref:bifunctional enoyl-CoA hydratase/phosphate acetyltransferase n=1 Tax=Pseudoteredinibacter isoporae TaxID=570281 RepID=UPI0031045004